MVGGLAAPQDAWDVSLRCRALGRRAGSVPGLVAHTPQRGESWCLAAKLSSWPARLPCLLCVPVPSAALHPTHSSHSPPSQLHFLHVVPVPLPEVVGGLGGLDTGLVSVDPDPKEDIKHVRGRDWGVHIPGSPAAVHGTRPALHGRRVQRVPARFSHTHITCMRRSRRRRSLSSAALRPRWPPRASHTRHVAGGLWAGKQPGP